MAASGQKPPREPVSVLVWGTLRDALDGRERIEVRAGTIRELLDRLAEDYPVLRPQLEKNGVSVSIDGQIYNGSWFKPIGPEQEIVLLPRIRGG